jgi:hypothetical protein
MIRGLMKAAIVALGVMAAAPLSAQQPDRMQARREWMARPGQGARQAGPRHRRMRRHRRHAAYRRSMRMRAFRMQRGWR